MPDNLASDWLETRFSDWQNAAQMIRSAGYIHPAEMIEIMAEEIKQLRSDLIAFCAPWAAIYAHDHGLPDGHLHPTHYDILARAGARMDSFVRGAITSAETSAEIADIGRQDGA